MKRLLIAVACLLLAGVAFGQTFEKGGVVALHRYEFTPAPGISIDQVLEFWVEKLIPETKKVFPGSTSQTLKGIGENNQHQYGYFHHWDSLEQFRSYWNDDGTPTEKGAAAMAKLQPLIEEINKLCTYKQIPGDWLILSE